MIFQKFNYFTCKEIELYGKSRDKTRVLDSVNTKNCH